MFFTDLPLSIFAALPYMMIVSVILTLFIVPSILGVCYLLSKHTDIGFWEPIIVFAVICVIAYIFNANAPMVVLMVVLAGILLGVTALWLVFLFYACIAVFAGKRRAKLVKVETPERKRSPFAFYEIDGEACQCFIGGASKKCTVGNEYNVKYSRLFKKVFDKRAVAICAGGVIIGVMGALLFILPMVFMEYLPFV